MDASGTRRMLGVGLVAVGLVGTACDDERQIEASVDARSGLSQPDEASGSLLVESEACERYEAALSEAISSLGCDDVELAACPSLIRPGSSLACVQYSESSVSECESVVEDYKRCSDFQRKTCLLTAVVDKMSDGCVPPALPGEGEVDAGSLDAGSAHHVDAGGRGAPDSGGPEQFDGGKSRRGDAGRPPVTPPPLDASTASGGSDSGAVTAVDGGV